MLSGGDARRLTVQVSCVFLHLSTPLKSSLFSRGLIERLGKVLTRGATLQSVPLTQAYVLEEEVPLRFDLAVCNPRCGRVSP